MLLLPAVGPLSAAAVRLLADGPPVPDPDVRVADPLTDHDLHLALWLLYELHYRGFDDVPDDAEWDPDVLRLRRRLEQCFLGALRREVPVPGGGDVVARLQRVAGSDDGPSLSEHLRRHAGREQFAEFAVHRSVYHLKEADPHTFGIPRLGGRAKAAFVEIQADEYGGGRVERMHSTLFATTMRALGLDDTYGRYVADVPGITLATNNVMSLFGLHRALRGAIVGHLALIEMTSSLPMRRYGQGFRRLGAAEDACRFFDEHVEADAVHEQIALHELCARLAADEPALADDIVFGAACGAHLDTLFARHLLDAWDAGGSSLLQHSQPAAA